MMRSKAEWRRDLLAARNALPEQTRRTSSAAIVQRLRGLRCVREASAVFGYVAIGAEADPGAVLASVHEDGIAVFVPATTTWSNEPSWVRLFPAEPVRSVPPSGRDLAVALLPGVGFDRVGRRLGRGAGFFDRAIERLRAAGPAVVVGLTFDVQVVPVLPFDPWDQPMDIVVSETRMFGTTETGIDAIAAR